MKTILVTSDLTYVHQNYDNVIGSVLVNSGEHIVGIIFIKVGLLSAFGKMLYLYLVGCFNIANNLAKNIFNALIGKKVSLVKKYNIPFISTNSINDRATVSWIRQINPDIILNMRSRCIFKKAVLETPRLGCVNVHHGLLPCQRGLFCDLYAIEKNNETGFTIHEMTEKVDQGRIFYKEKIETEKNYTNYLKRASLKECTAIISFINKIAQDNFLPEGRLNRCDNPSVTATPDLKTIRRMQQNKIIL